MKNYFLTVTVFFVLSVLLMVGQNIVSKQSESMIKTAASTVLESWSNNAPEIGNKIKLQTKGLSYTWTFETILKGKKNGLVFITTLTGNSGPYTGIFLYTPQNEIQFCGLAGISGTKKSPGNYGISERIINAQIKKLDIIANEYGVAK